MARIEVTIGKKRQRLIALDVPRLVIGRGTDAMLVLEHEMVSRSHCEIFEDAGSHLVRDLGSTTGTFLNGTKITEARLREGDAIAIGKFTLNYLASPAEGVGEDPDTVQASAGDLWAGFGDEEVAAPSPKANEATLTSENAPVEAASSMAEGDQRDLDPTAHKGTLVASPGQMARIRAALETSQKPHLKVRLKGKQESVGMESFPFVVGHGGAVDLALPGSMWFGSKRFQIDKEGSNFQLKTLSWFAGVTVDGKKVSGSVSIKDGAAIETAGVKIRFGTGLAG